MSVTEALALPILRELRTHRLATVVVLAVACGDDLEAAAERMERVVEALPEAREFAKRGRGHEIAKQAKAIAEEGARDLRQLADREKTRGGDSMADDEKTEEAEAAARGAADGATADENDGDDEAAESGDEASSDEE